MLDGWQWGVGVISQSYDFAFDKKEILAALLKSKNRNDKPSQGNENQENIDTLLSIIIRHVYPRQNDIKSQHKDKLAQKDTIVLVNH